MDSQNDVKNDTQARLMVLRQLLREGMASTQEELGEALREKEFDVTQSTISRDLRRIGAIKTTNAEGEIVYKLPEAAPMPIAVSDNLGGMLLEIESNDSMVVLHTTPGSASLVARYIDSMRTYLGVLGTIAGDDTIFIAPKSTKQIKGVIQKIREEI